MSESLTSHRASLGPGKTLRTLGALEEYFWLLGQRAAIGKAERSAMRVL